MRDWQGKTYWIVGASEGLGRALAMTLSRVGCGLVVSARSSDRLDSLVAELPGRARAVTIDVNDPESVKKAAADVGEIDGLVYLAGTYDPMSATEWDTEKVVQMIETNVVGAVRTVGAVLPDMIAKDKGHIVLTGSLAGFRGMPGSIGYGSSKSAIMTLAEGMYIDLKGSNVEVQVVNPGFVKTRLTDKNDFKMPQLMEPDDAAREYFEHMNSDEFKKSFPFAFGTAIRLGQLLPDWLYFPLFSRKS
ncbi:SDR family NAD(P)-dependent oxidoreductase [Pelagovum pacificum]|uniref:SDR family NAD(P)-dependent oxidoreductase n=1 Tax=Pelagovum pacificum TaxID=2588711 RepID=A0A5C5GG44_9RHOB|nr:SDR family NAD(P)-dependent oxidoreductase [Pelagovum pacificum]QQA43143.1 SDR family NAD(P)-dependent oxidoreductase [Pelagovum pacificum]TNY33715.1 SDR family NAD(P)-dependent oxidoreductase [Pelagovum pacificum]